MFQDASPKCEHENENSIGGTSRLGPARCETGEETNIILKGCDYRSDP